MLHLRVLWRGFLSYPYWLLPGDVRRTSSSKVEEPPQSSPSPQSSSSVYTQQDLHKTPAETSSPDPRSGSTGMCRRSQSQTTSKTKNKIQKGEDSNDDPERRQVMEHYLSLRSSEWIPDGTGKWVKDENVEFDSDEEEPPAMPPP
ncbi:sodium channel modifier 1-like isoform X2 [Bufo gargarizans]|uniref:sodium channel modifier 1-like isoform X2 n=1 Tax=Bufo gargarizans TaxID=30331 RepID=UPI001CF435A0|nr:sodium channel modifier 1-like isoform X2 [Bufo gargarizans]